MSIDTNNSASTRTVVDWDDAPEGATHSLIKDSGVAWFKFKDDNSFPNTWKDGEWKNVRLPTRELTPKPKQPKTLTQAVFDGLPPEYRWAAVDADGSVHCFHEPPIPTNSGEWIYNKYLICEDWHDVAANWQNSLIERETENPVSEQNQPVERKHSHYFKDVSGVDQIDVYAVLRLFEVTDPCLQHIVKKALCAGKRGAKDWAKDVQEIADTANRLIELERAK